MIKRPEAISVSYLNELGDEIETSFRDFKARMFLHELDHVNGKTMTHW
jgi:chaperonin cofactor prefoldin